ncbi:MAG TPA: hypothetical protein VG317_09080 [Pseudonocardiaceae bacterium]|jgi:uncharacterized protein YukE|nr:hypothetical protein [Pseudonocardiaceae bacterium]
MAGYQANHQEITDTGAKTADKAQEAESIRSKVDAANGLVPSKAWGLLGNMTVYGKYTEMYSTFSEHVNKMVQGVQHLADDIKTTADQYKQNEEAVQEKFKEIENEMGGAPQPPTMGPAPKGA